MHELSIAQSILDIVREYIPEPRSAEAQSIKVRLGGLSGVVPASLDFCFSAITNDTSLRQAKLNIELVEMLNSPQGVFIEAEGEAGLLDNFLLRLDREKPRAN
jgi:Zn finger protein HypA/HybF involved in hydrogenase expression